MPAPVAQRYDPTLRDRVANRLLDWLGNGPTQQHFVEGMMGSTGLGTTRPGVLDFIPGVGQAFQADEAGRQMGHGHPVSGGANLLLAALPLPMAAKEARGAVSGTNRLIPQAVERVAEPITAYHGSPYAFDRFSLDHVGTGEGAQAYGHGLYFAENENVAKGYRDRLTPEGETGRVYHVGINADPKRFLDWEAPLSDHPDDVQNAVLHVRFKGDADQVRVAKASPFYMGRSIQSIMYDLGHDTVSGSPAKAATALAEQGVPGIKYRDYGAREAYGTRGYVVFKPEIIDIMKRYGVAAPVAASMLAAQQQTQPQAGVSQ